MQSWTTPEALALLLLAWQEQPMRSFHTHTQLHTLELLFKVAKGHSDAKWWSHVQKRIKRYTHLHVNILTVSTGYLEVSSPLSSLVCYVTWGQHSQWTENKEIFSLSAVSVAVSLKLYFRAAARVYLPKQHRQSQDLLI